MAYDVSELLEQLQTRAPRSWKTRQVAAYKLGRAGDSSAVQPLIEAVQNDESLYVRMAAITALGRIGDGEAVPTLTQALDDDYYLLQQSAIWALGDVGAAAEESLPRLQQFTESTERYDQAELTVAEIAELVIKRIETAVEQGDAPEEGSEEAAAAVESSGGGERGDVQGNFVERMRKQAQEARDAAKAAMDG